MTPETIIAVAGFGRCGSSLMMRMLHAGGVPVYCDNYSSYETEKIQGLPKKWEWLSDAKGKAIKTLDLHRWKLHSDFQYKIIWLDRNRTEQAKSAIKLLKELGEIKFSSREQLRGMARGYEKEMPAVTRSLAALNSEVLKLTFEQLINSPLRSAQSVEEFLGIKMNTYKMAAQVRPRGTACLPYLMEYSQLT